MLVVRINERVSIREQVGIVGNGANSVLTMDAEECEAHGEHK